MPPQFDGRLRFDGSEFLPAKDKERHISLREKTIMEMERFVEWFACQRASIYFARQRRRDYGCGEFEHCFHRFKDKSVPLPKCGIVGMLRRFRVRTSMPYLQLMNTMGMA